MIARDAARVLGCVSDPKFDQVPTTTWVELKEQKREARAARRRACVSAHRLRMSTFLIPFDVLMLAVIFHWRV